MSNKPKPLDDFASGPMEEGITDPWGYFIPTGPGSGPGTLEQPGPSSPWNVGQGQKDYSYGDQGPGIPSFGAPKFGVIDKAKNAWRVFSTVGKNIPIWNRIGGVGRAIALVTGGISAYQGVKSAAGHVNDASPVTKDSTLDYAQTLKNSYSFPSIVRSSTNINAPMPTNVNFLGKNYNLSYDSENNIFTFDTEYGKMYVNPDTGIGSFTSPIDE